jgi:hypothetical protein
LSPSLEPGEAQTWIGTAREGLCFYSFIAVPSSTSPCTGLNRNTKEQFDAGLKITVAARAIAQEPREDTAAAAGRLHAYALPQVVLLLIHGYRLLAGRMVVQEADPLLPSDAVLHAALQPTKETSDKDRMQNHILLENSRLAGT